MLFEKPKTQRGHSGVVPHCVAHCVVSSLWQVIIANCQNNVATYVCLLLFLIPIFDKGRH